MTKKKDPKDLLKRGRPTEYRSEYCEKLIEHMKEGLSFETFGVTIGVGKDRVFEWAKIHPEFADAKEIALNENLLWFERQAKKGMWIEKDQPVLNNTIWVFSMKNRHGWRDRHETDSTVKVEIEREKIKSLTDAELAALVKQHLPEEKK